MAVGFFTDPHLGLRRQAHTTPASLLALRERLFTVTEDLVRRRFKGMPTICAGDWFDKSHNDEATLLRAHPIIAATTLSEGGNHDMDNSADAVTTLQAIQQLLPDGESRIITAPFAGTKVHWQAMQGEGLVVCMVPHHTTQDLFMEALERAVEGSKDGAIAEQSKVLVLHCNYDSPFATHETSLNLTEDDVTFLLEHFDYILIGHEHPPRDLFGGRLIILGNTHPTSFADISMKRVAIWENGEFRFETIWEPAGKFVKVHHKDLGLADFSQAEFVHIHGEVEPGEVLGIMREARRLTKDCAGLFMLRVDLETKQLHKVTTDKVVETMTLPQRIELELTNSGDAESLQLWREITAEA